MSHPTFDSIGEYVNGTGEAGATATAGGSGDATETNLSIVDRAVAGGRIYKSAIFVLLVRATLAANKTCVLKATFQHDTAVGGGTMADVAAALQPEGAADSVVLTLTDSGAGGTQRGAYTRNVDLISLNRYIRAQVHIDLNAANTDTAEYLAYWILGGADALPV